MRKLLVLLMFLFSVCDIQAVSITEQNILTFQTWDVEHYNSSGWTGKTGGYITSGWNWSCTNCGSTTSGTVQRVTRSSDDTVIFVYLLDSSGNLVISEPGGIYTYDGIPPAPANTLCCGGSTGTFSADTNHVNKSTSFVNRTTPTSNVYIEQLGNSNNITIEQTGTRNNYSKYYGSGDNNTISITQSGTNNTQANYVDATVSGNSNNVNLQQQSTGGGKGIFATVNNNNNTLLVQQKDSGSHYTDVSLSGGNKNVDILQQGSAGHMAKVTLTGLSTDLSLSQSGSNQNFYSINFNCATTGGCAKITVQQGQ
jgi:hypothetical protein